MLQSSLPELPPDNIIHDVTPWRRASERVILGFALCSLTLNFLCLNYILPAVGMVLMLLGFRSLRRENLWFRLCWFAAIIRVAYFFPFLILNTTVLPYIMPAASIVGISAVFNLVLILAQIFCLRKGFMAIQLKAGLPAHAGGTSALMVWYALMLVLALLHYSGLVIGIIFIVAYIFIIRSLFSLSRELDEAGYAIQPAPVRLSDKTLALAITASLICGMVCGYLFGSRYPMEWSDVSARQAETAAVMKELEGLGFPREVLEDLSDEDILDCRGAQLVLVDTSDEAVNDGRTVVEREADFINEYTVYDVKELHVTGIAVLLPGEPEQWKIFHHFRWTTDPGFYGTESIQLWPAYYLREGWEASGDISGQVLYNNDGQSCVSPYYFLDSRSYTSNSIFWGEKNSTDIFAAFSFPAKGEGQRGYVSYAIAETNDGWMVNSWFNYTHQRGWAQYPVMPAMEKRMAGGFNTDGVFITVQDALQFFFGENGVDMIN